MSKNETDPDADFECGVENDKAAPERERRARWREFVKQPWAPGALPGDAMAAIQAKRTIWLKEAIDLMAFSWCSGPMDLVEQNARRTQAWRALCEAVQGGHLALRGSKNKPSDDVEEIPAHYFNISRRLGGESVLEIDLGDEDVSDQTFDSTKDRTKWFDVGVVEPRRFTQWLLSQIVLTNPSERLNLPNAEKAYLQWEADFLSTHNKLPSQPEYEEWFRNKFDTDRETARNIVKRISPRKVGRPSRG